jgi:hypothetical protein
MQGSATVPAHPLKLAGATPRTNSRAQSTKRLQFPAGRAATPAPLQLRPRQISIGLPGAGIRWEVAMGLRPGIVPFSASVDEVRRIVNWGFGAPPSPSPGSGGDIAPRAPLVGLRRHPTRILQLARSSCSPLLTGGSIPPPAAQSWGLQCFSDVLSSRSAQPSRFS